MAFDFAAYINFSLLYTGTVLFMTDEHIQIGAGTAGAKMACCGEEREDLQRDAARAAERQRAAKCSCNDGHGQIQAK